MRNIILTMVLACGIIFSSQAQDRGDWYVGTGDVANVAWTDWAVSPTLGYGVTDNIMVGLSVSQADSTQDMEYKLHARYYMNNLFVYVSTDGASTEGISYGVGKMFTVRNNIYIDPKIVYNSGEKTTNLTLGFGLKF